MKNFRNDKELDKFKNKYQTPETSLRKRTSSYFKPLPEQGEEDEGDRLY